MSLINFINHFCPNLGKCSPSVIFNGRKQRCSTSAEATHPILCRYIQACERRFVLPILQRCWHLQADILQHHLGPMSQIRDLGEIRQSRYHQYLSHTTSSRYTAQRSLRFRSSLRGYDKARIPGLHVTAERSRISH